MDTSQSENELDSHPQNVSIITEKKSISLPLPHRRDPNSWGWGSERPKNFKGKNERAKLEFPEGWGKETLSCGGGRREFGYFQDYIMMTF